MERDNSSWTFFSNHGRVYFILALNEDMVLRDVASQVGITERSVLGIVKDLEDAGYIKRRKVGRHNEYKVIPRKKLRHHLESNVPLCDLVDIMKKAQE